MFKNEGSWSLEECQKILNLPAHLIAVLNQDGQVLKSNKEISHVLGWETAEILGMNVADLIHHDDVNDTFSSLNDLISGNKKLVQNLVIRCRCKDGSFRHISWTAEKHDNKVFALGTDITEKVRYEEKFLLHSLILESISEGVLIVNKNREIIYANSAEEELFGYENGELIGRPIDILNALTKDETDKIFKEVIHHVKTRGLWQGEWVNVKKDQTKFITSGRITELWINGEMHIIIVQRDVTARKREVKLIDSLQNRFKTLFEQSSVAMEIFDLSGNLLDVNKAWCKLFDAEPSSIIGYNIFKDPQSERILPYIERAFNGEEVEIPAFKIDPNPFNKAAKPRWVEAWFSPVRGDDGAVKEMAVFLKDVTDRIETQIQLQKSITARKVIEDRLSMAVKIGKVGIWEWKLETDELYADDTTLQLYGFGRVKFNGKFDDFFSSVHHEDRKLIIDTVLESQSKKETFMIEHRIVRKDGELRWLQMAGTTFYDESGKPVLMTGTCSDITEKKVAALDQQFLVEVSQILSRSFDFRSNVQEVADYSTTYFCDGCIVDQLKSDGSIERIVVGMKDELIRNRIFRLQQKYPGRYTHNHPLFDTLVSGKIFFLEDCRNVWPILRENYGEEYFLEALSINIKSIITVRLRGRDSLLGTITFFTQEGSKFKFSERHKLLAEEIAYRTSMSLENSLLYLNSQEAIKSRDEFLSIASHELKTPLTSLTLQNQMRKRQLDKGEAIHLDEVKFRKMIEADDRQLRRINRLIDDMLDIARIRAQRLTIHKESFDFCPFLSDVVDRVAPQMEAAGCALSVNLCESFTIKADIYRIEQVIVNLLTNALKYGAGKPVRIDVEKFTYKVRVLIHDEGPGIHPNDSERIFKRFERATSSREISGLGLGLYISRQIVQQHDGALYVAPKAGKGSTFVMELPLNDA